MNNYSLWNQAKLPPELTDKLNAIIRRVRIIQLLRGILAVVGVAIACTLVIIAVDAAVTIYSDGIRALISLSGLVLTLLTAYIALVRPLTDKISPIRMARIIETRHPELQERISSALELILIGGDEATVGSSQLLELLVADARTDIAGLSAAKEFRGSSMRPVAFAAIVFLVIQLILLAVRPKDTILLIARAYAPFARLNNLAARSFTVTPGDIVIVEGERVSFTLTAPGETGSRAELCIERKGEPLSIERMTKRFDLDGGDPVFEVQIPYVSESFDYRMRIGKALTRRYSVVAVPPPAFNEIVCDIEPPTYTGILPTQYVGNVEMAISAPVGTKAQVKAFLNREMDSILTFDNRRTISPQNSQPNGIAEFVWTVTTNRATSWAISLTDSRGFTNILSWATYDPVPDYPPDVRLTYPTGNSYVLPTYGHLKTVFDIRDDYGITNAVLVMLPDNEKFPWTTEVAVEAASKGLWRVVQDISLGEFMIGGAKKIRIWLEVSDNLPVELGGPNISKSRTIAVNLDNAERRSLADQVRIPERDSITNLLESAASRLEQAAKRLASTTNNPSLKQKDLDAAMEEAEKAMAEVAEKTEEAGEKADKGLFAGVSEKIEEVKKESVEEARKAVEEVPLTEETEREEVIKDAVEKMNKAAEEARSTIPEILEKDALLKEASDLESLATKEADLAKKAKERQLTDEELLDWQARQKELANQFGALEDKIAEREDVQKSFLPEEKKAEAKAKGEEVKTETAKAAEPKSEAEQATKEASGETEKGQEAKKADKSGSQAKAAEQKSKEEQAANEAEAKAKAAAPKQSGDKKAEDKADAQQKASPKAAAEAAAKAAEAAMGKPKDEEMLKKARETEQAAKESKRAAAESQRAKAALNAIEKDKEALKEIEAQAEKAQAEAEELADDAFNVNLERVRYEAQKVDPELMKADELSKKADELADMIEKAALNPESISPAKLEALANEVQNKSEELAKSNDPILQRAAELAKNVAKAAKETALENENKLRDSSSDDEADDKKDAVAGVDDINTPEDVEDELADAAEEIAAAKASEDAKDAAKAIKDELKKTAVSPSEQALKAAIEADKLSTAATNLAARLDRAVKAAQQAANPNAQKPAEQKSAKSKDGEASPKEGTADSFEALAKEAEELAKKAEEANAEAQDAARRTRNKGEMRAASVADRANKSTQEVKNAADAIKRAADAMPKTERKPSTPNGEQAAKDSAESKGNAAIEPPKPPPRETVNEANKANRAAALAKKYSDDGEKETERLKKSATEHAKDATEATERAVDLARALSDSMQPPNKDNEAKAGKAKGKKAEGDKGADSKAAPIPEKPEEIREELKKAIEKASEAARSAEEMSRDTKENLPDITASIAKRALDNANSIGKAYDALNPPPGRPKANKEQMAKNAEAALERAEKQLELAKTYADKAGETPEEHVEALEAYRENIDNKLKELSNDMKTAAEAIKRDTPIAVTNAHAKANIEGAQRALEEYGEELEEHYDSLSTMLDELPRFAENARRIGQIERAEATSQGMKDIEMTPGELASQEINRLREELRQARAKAGDLKYATTIPKSPDRMLKAINDADKKLPDYKPGKLSKESKERAAAKRADANKTQDGNQQADEQKGDGQQGDAESGAQQGSDGKQSGEQQQSASQSGDQAEGTKAQAEASVNEEAPWNQSDLITSATGETRALANRLAEAKEHTEEARDALELGDANQAREIAKEAADVAKAIAQRAANSESARQASAARSQDNSRRSAASANKRASDLIKQLIEQAKRREAEEQKKQQASSGGGSTEPSKEKSGSGGGKRQQQDDDDEPKEFTGERPPEVDVPTYDEFLGGLTQAASNIVAAAAIADESPQEASRLAEAAIREALKLQAPSDEQLEAARLANLASQDLRRLAAETAALAGLDPETMKIKKPKNYVPDKEKKEASEKKKKPARTFVEGNGGDPDENDDAEIEYEDGISLEMPEWLKRLGFPVSEWLKYKGSLESGLPDSALEHVAPEYRNLVREYFKLLSKEK